MNSLSAVFAGQVERAAAVVVIDQVDAGCSRGTDAGCAIVDVLLAVLASVAYLKFHHFKVNIEMMTIGLCKIPICLNRSIKKSPKAKTDVL